MGDHVRTHIDKPDPKIYPPQSVREVSDDLKGAVIDQAHAVGRVVKSVFVRLFQNSPEPVLPASSKNQGQSHMTNIAATKPERKIPAKVGHD